MVSRSVQLQRSLSETRGTNNSGTASWPACQECLHHSRVIFVCQDTLVILCSITLNNGLLPFLGHSFSRCFFRSPRICAWSWGDDHSRAFSLRWLLPLRDSAVPARWLVYSCNPGTVWGPFPYPLDFPFAKEPVGVCCYGDFEHLWTPLSLGAAAVSLLK